MFRRLKSLFTYTLTLNRVHDKFVVKEGNERITLRVDSDPMLMVTRIRNANEKMLEAKKEDATEDQRKLAAIMFAEAMFGKEQTEKLLAFYGGDYACVMTISALYFENRLSGKITKAQKKSK